MQNVCFTLCDKKGPTSPPAYVYRFKSKHAQTSQTCNGSDEPVINRPAKSNEPVHSRPVRVKMNLFVANQRGLKRAYT